MRRPFCNPTIHRNPLVPVLAALACALGTPSAPAQSTSAICVPLPAVADTAPTTHEVERAVERAAATGVGLWRIDGGLVAVGPDYRAMFDGQGFRFDPALGAAVDVTQTLAFELTSIRCGDATLFEVATSTGGSDNACGDTARTAPSADGHEVVLARGGGIVERYAITTDGVAQSFTFATLPDARGDLVVRGRVRTPLTCNAEGRVHAGLAFRRAGPTARAGIDSGIDTIRYGAVTGIDAAGRTARGWLAWQPTLPSGRGDPRDDAGGVLELGLPAGFVATAELPLVLDPLIGNVFDPTPDLAGSEERPDVAVIDGVGYLVVWEQRLSSTDADVLGQRLALDGQLLGPLLAIATGTPEQSHPAVGAYGSPDRYLVAWRERSGSSQRVLARVIDGAWNGTMGNQLVVQSPIVPISDFALDVGGDHGHSTPGLGTAVVVWADGGSVVLRYATIPLSGDPTFDTAQVVSTGTNNLHPSISDGEPGRLVVWERRNTSPPPGHSDVWGRRVERDPARWWAPTLIEAVGSHDETWPRAAGHHDFAWLVVWQRDETPGATNHDVFVKPISASGTSLVVPNTRLPVAADPNEDEIEPFVVEGFPMALAGWSNRNLLGYAIHVRRLDMRTGTPCQIVEVVDTPRNLAARSPQATLGGSFPAQEGLIVWSQQVLRGGGGDVLARRYAIFATGGTVQDLGGACGIPVAARVSGPVAIGNSALRFQLSGSWSSSTAIVFHVGVAGQPITCGTCAVLPPLVSLPPVVDQHFQVAEVRLPIPCDPRFVGVSFVTQWLLYPTNASPCPIVPGLTASTQFAVTIGT